MSNVSLETQKRVFNLSQSMSGKSELFSLFPKQETRRFMRQEMKMARNEGFLAVAVVWYVIRIMMMTSGNGLGTEH